VNLHKRRGISFAAALFAKSVGSGRGDFDADDLAQMHLVRCGSAGLQLGNAAELRLDGRRRNEIFDRRAACSLGAGRFDVTPGSRPRGGAGRVEAAAR